MLYNSTVSHGLPGMLRCAERRYCWFHLRNVDVVSFFELIIAEASHRPPLTICALSVTLQGRVILPSRKPVGVLRFTEASHRPPLTICALSVTLQGRVILPRRKPVGVLRVGTAGFTCVTLTSHHFLPSPSTHDLRLVGYAARTRNLEVATIAKPQASRRALRRYCWFHLRNVDIVSFFGQPSPSTHDLRLVGYAARTRNLEVATIAKPQASRRALRRYCWFHLRNVDIVSFFELIIAEASHRPPLTICTLSVTLQGRVILPSRKPVGVLRFTEASHRPPLTICALSVTLQGRVILTSRKRVDVLRYARRYCWFNLRNVDIASFLDLLRPAIALELQAAVMELAERSAYNPRNANAMVALVASWHRRKTSPGCKVLYYCKIFYVRCCLPRIGIEF
ncbi:hypothetical protein C8R43DRAFT_1141829 [Mycena crocata]|nr:hypothetical protein C8R43DRAFT_1141829 [Mycena crocata]